MSDLGLRVRSFFFGVPPRWGGHNHFLETVCRYLVMALINFFFLRNTRRRSQTHTHSSLWIHARNPTSMSTSERLNRLIFEIDEVTTGVSLSTDTAPTTERVSLSTDTAPTTKRIVPVKSWNNFRKMRAPVPSRGLEPWWAGSTTRNLTSWATLSSP